MKAVGIVGGVASGKSLVTEHLARLGAAVISADQIGHQVLREPEVIAQLRARWGDDILTPDGHIFRPAVASIVFDPNRTGERKFLDEVTHPRITAQMREQLENLRQSGTTAVAAVDAALLLETGWNQFCDMVWFVDAPEDVRYERARSRGWSEQQWREREAAQWPVERKRQSADVIIDNAGAREATERQVEQNFQKLVT